MMKKLTALLLALAMVFSLVTVASADADSTIDKVELSHAELTVGQPLPELTAPAGASYTVKNYWWQDLTGGATPTVVELGHRYRLQMEIRPAEGYAFATDAVLLVNGVRVLGNDKAPIQIRPNLIYAMHDYSAAPTVDKVEIFFDEPIQAGPVPEFTVPAGANYTLTVAQWQERDAIYEDEIPEITELKEGVAYTLVLQVRPVAGYEIGDGVKLYLNGKETAISYKNWSYVQYQCDVTIGGGLDTPVVTATTKAATGKPYLQWDAVEGAVAYEIWRAVDDGAFSRYYTTEYTFFNNLSAKVGTTYKYQVRAVAADGTTGGFSEAKLVVCVCAAPDVRIRLNENGKPYLYWEKNPDAVKYEIWRSVDGGDFRYYYTTNYTADNVYCSFTNTSAQQGHAYAYQVRAVGQRSNLNSPFSAAASIVCGLPAPQVTLTNNPKTGVPQLTWEPVEGAVGYEIQRGVTGWKDYKYYYTAAADVTVFNNVSAKVGETYYYKIRALAADGSANSAWTFAGSKTAVCATPTLWWNRAENGAIVLSWSAVEGAERYEIWRSVKGGTFRSWKKTTETTYVDDMEAVGYTAVYQVRALGKTSETDGALSNVSNATYRKAPDIRIDLNADGKPAIYWSPTMNVMDFVVYRAVGDGEFSYYYSTDNTFFNNISAEPGVTYRYKVRARTADPNTGDFIYSPYTEEVSITSN